MKRRYPIAGIVLLLLFLCVPAMKAQDGLCGALSSAAEAAHAVPDFLAQTAVADFDNDQKPDGAILLESGLVDGRRFFRIEFHLTAASNGEITFSSAERELSISALDVNRDGAPDIIIERAFSHQRLQVYLNDGHGAFHQARTEDYPSPDSSSPNWRTQLSQNPPPFCLPLSRSLECRRLQRISAFSRNPSEQLNLWLEVFMAQSGARAPTASRAPPLLRSL